MKKRPTEQERVQKALAELSEHFDTVAIFTTRHENHETFTTDEQSGNWYAIYGHISEWMEQQKEIQRNNAPVDFGIDDKDDDDDDDDEEKKIEV